MISLASRFLAGLALAALLVPRAGHGSAHQRRPHDAAATAHRARRHPTLPYPGGDRHPRVHPGRGRCGSRWTMPR